MSNVLLIESDKILAANVTKVLQRSGHNVDWQIDPQVALDKVDANLPQLIILDLVLAGRSGIEFLYEFRSYPDWQTLPVIIFSSYAVEELKETLASFEHLNIS